MGGIAILAPSEQLLEIALEIAEENKNVMICKRIYKDIAVEEARKAIEAGAKVIVARGHQAVVIEEQVNIPVSEIVWTAQEVGITVLEAKKQSKKAKPIIGIIGLMRMFCETSYLEQYYNVELKSFFYETPDQMQDALDWISRERVDAVIGENSIMEKVNNQVPDIPTVPMMVTGESLRIAVRYADTLLKASETELHNKAQMSSLLDSAFNGLIQINESGKIVMVNRVMEGILKTSQEAVLSKHVKDVIKEINLDMINQVLHSPSESFSTFLNVNGNAAVMISSPIAVESDISGAYLSFKRIKKDEETNFVLRDPETSKKNLAIRTFDSLMYKSTQMKQLVERAKLYAQSNTPLMISGQSGDDREGICQAIHNYSPRKKGPYISTSLVGLTEDGQLELLFGNYGGDRRPGDMRMGLLEKADGGTLVINGIGFITRRTQSSICRFVRETSAILKQNGDMKVVDVRIIITSTEDIYAMRKNNIITNTFYYIFSGLSLRVPGFEERMDDVENFIRIYMERYTQKYSRFQVLSPEAMNYLRAYSWKGNALQIERFVERLVLTVEKRTIKRSMVEAVLSEMYPDLTEEDNIERELPLVNEKQDVYENLLRATFLQYKGNRSATAEALGISTTTLWRKMKKYGIAD